LTAAAAVFVALGGLAAAALLALARRRAPLLPPPLAPAPPVAALLPVRDEEANVEACVTALLAQSAPVAVRVIDDGSTDATAAIAERLARADPRVELVRVTTPPAPGQSGKVNALAFGSRGVEATWLLGIDADARPAPDAVARALAAAQRENLDAVSLAARQRVASPGEALLTPLVMALLDALLGDWRRTARGEGEPVANGQFLLVRRAALEAIGGYPAIADQPLDDVALARRLVAGGFRVGFWRAREQLEVRMYDGFRATWRGWRRNLALIVGARPALAALAAALPLIPAATALVALAAGSRLAALIAWLGGVGASALARTGTGSSPAWGALYPFDATVLAGCLGGAVADRARGTISPWRGRALSARRQGDASGAE
jgi:cellulose synthase/poly-beta-1,6-N-acetylglucosamine synthase-like glycosyltransferase